jgi:hypothetical protein
MYDPPYESPLENYFAWQMSKYLRRDTTLRKQVEAQTICGRFRMDFVAISPSGKRIAYECDGEEFHEPRRDEWRDAMILGTDSVDAIIRLRGLDLTYHGDDLLLLLAKWDPDLFSDRSQIILNRLASDSARAYQHESQTMAMVTFPHEDQNDPFFIFLHRRSRVVPTGQREYWQTVHRFALSCGTGDLDSVIEKWKAAGSGTARQVNCGPKSPRGA